LLISIYEAKNHQQVEVGARAGAGRRAQHGAGAGGEGAHGGALLCRQRKTTRGGEEGADQWAQAAAR